MRQNQDYGTKKSKLPLIEGLEITTLAAEGKAMGRWNDVVVFVPLTVPGDVVDVQIRSKRRRFMEGFVVRYVKKSPLRAEAFCEHFGVCGGCKWQNLPYEEQLRFKTGQVYDQLARIGKIALPEIAPCLGSARTQFYRNKLEFTFADRRWLTREEVEGGADIGAAPALGFHIPGMFDKVLDIRKCWLQPDPSNDIRMETKRFCVENGYTFHNAREHTGLMRNMIVRTASTGEVMVIVVFGADDRERIGALLDHLAERFPGITSLFYVVNTKLNDSVGDLDPVCWRGKDHIIEQMEGLRFKVGPKSFYQTKFGAGLRALQGGARLCRPAARRHPLRPLYRYGNHRQFLCVALPEGRGRGVRPRGDCRREDQLRTERHRQHGFLCR
mgnify:CR=1 FL=1